MNIDIERLEVDESQWPEGKTHYCTMADKFMEETPETACEHCIPRPKPQSQEWDGEGLPPVGVECETNTQYGWLPCTIVAHGEDYAVAHIHPNDSNLKVDWSRTGFRPIRTQEQREREEFARAILDDLDALRVNISGDTATAIAIGFMNRGWRMS